MASSAPDSSRHRGPGVHLLHAICVCILLRQNLHRQLAPFILNDDQSFVDRQEMQESLKKMVAARKIAADSEPSDDSLIYHLWMKHWGKPPQHISRNISDEESKQIMERMKPIIEALREQKREQGPQISCIVQRKAMLHEVPTHPRRPPRPRC